MSFANPVFRDCGSSNKTPCFVGEAQGEDIWDAVENGPFIPTTVINNVEQVKVKGFWNNDDKKKMLFDKRLRTCFNHP